MAAIAASGSTRQEPVRIGCAGDEIFNAEGLGDPREHQVTTVFGEIVGTTGEDDPYEGDAGILAQVAGDVAGEVRTHRAIHHREIGPKYLNRSGASVVEAFPPFLELRT